MSQKFIDGNNLKRTVDYLVDGTIPIANSNLAPAYSSTTAYKIGNLLTYLGKQYYCIADAPAGTLPTNTTYFEEKSVADIIEMIKAGTIPVGLSDMAKNLTPYSEDSGAIQDTPFISQGTGTGNNSVIVTTGDTAKQLEKLGNAPVVNQLCYDPYFTSQANWKVYNSQYSRINSMTGGVAEVEVLAVPASDYSVMLQESNVNRAKAVIGHRYLYIGSVWLSRNGIFRLYNGNGALYNPKAITANTWLTIYDINTATREQTYMCAYPESPAVGDIFKCKDFFNIDLDLWFSGDIPQDVLDNPSHFSWYYNGNLAFNAGEIKHGEGVKLVCTRGRNLWDGTFSYTGTYLKDDGSIATNASYNVTDYIMVVPNRPYHFANTDGSNPSLCFYDKNKNFISGIKNSILGNAIYNHVATTPANCMYIRHSIQTEQCITPYYTPAEGGEGYGVIYPYEEPDIIDTGSEQLGAFDKKTPDGVITRRTYKPDLTQLTWGISGGRFYATLPQTCVSTHISYATIVYSAIFTRYKLDNAIWNTSSTVDKVYGISTSSGTSRIYIRDNSYNDVESFVASLTSGMIECELETPTTEQGTAFRQYAGINDYGIMYWLDENDELVSIPQGCKIQYPVNYKGFIDDAYMYTNGDVTKLAKNESITDSALNARGYYKMQDLLTFFNKSIGGTLRQALCQKATLDFGDTDYKDLGTMTWVKDGTRFISNDLDGFVEAQTFSPIICTDIRSKASGEAKGIWVGQAAYSSNKTSICVDGYSDVGTADQFKAFVNGVLIAYKKA